MTGNTLALLPDRGGQDVLEADPATARMEAVGAEPGVGGSEVARVYAWM